MSLIDAAPPLAVTVAGYADSRISYGIEAQELGAAIELLETRRLVVGQRAPRSSARSSRSG